MIKIGVVNGDVIEAGATKNVTNNYYGDAVQCQNMANNQDEASDLQATNQDAALENIIFQDSLVAGCPERLDRFFDLIDDVLPKLKGKNELFWLMAALEDAEVANYLFGPSDMLRQLRAWFPDNEWFSTDKNIENAGKSISKERKKREIGGKRLKVKDIAANVRSRTIPKEWIAKEKLNQSKLERISLIANSEMLIPLIELKREFQA